MAYKNNFNAKVLLFNSLWQQKKNNNKNGAK